MHVRLSSGEISCCSALVRLALKASLCLNRYDPLSWEYPTWASINGPAVNILKGALVTSDRVVTVSEVTHPFQTWMCRPPVYLMYRTALG